MIRTDSVPPSNANLTIPCRHCSVSKIRCSCNEFARPPSSLLRTGLQPTLVISTLVLEEAGHGDPDASRDRLAALEPLTVLDASDDSIALANALIQARAIPAGAAQDAAHTAIAVVNRVEYLSTWNLRHIANPNAAIRIEQACRAADYEPAKICTPRQIMEARHEEL